MTEDEIKAGIEEGFAAWARGEEAVWRAERNFCSAYNPPLVCHLAERLKVGNVEVVKSETRAANCPPGGTPRLREDGWLIGVPARPMPDGHQAQVDRVAAAKAEVERLEKELRAAKLALESEESAESELRRKAYDWFWRGKSNLKKVQALPGGFVCPVPAELIEENAEYQQWWMSRNGWAAGYPEDVRRELMTIDHRM